MRRTLGISLVIAIALSLVTSANTASAASVTRWVNDNDPNGLFGGAPGTSCNDPGYSTIQAAVTAAGPGDRINVCPGSYPEQVVIEGPGKNDIQLRSTSVWQAIIKAPTLMIPAGPALANSIVRINNAQNVQILAFTIMGPGSGICDTPTALDFGVKVEGGASADIFGNNITHIRDNPVFLGCQSGVAVQVGRDFEGTTGRARIIGNLIDDYNKNGITVDGLSYAEIAYNRIIGAGPTILTAQNGVQISRGATAKLRHNFVNGNDYSGSPLVAVATGILLFMPNVVSIERNTTNLNGVGIFDFAAGVGTTIKNNTSRASSFDGIALQDLTGQRVEANKSHDNAGPGISLYGAVQNTIKSNWVTSNKGTGILLDNNGGVPVAFGSDQNSVRYNVVTFNGTAETLPDTTDGIRINAPSTTNTIDRNYLKRNITHDCHDGSTGNTWTNNFAQTSLPADLCDNDEHADKDCNDANHGWDKSYKWNAEFGVPTDMDFTTAYNAAVDIDALVRSLPALLPTTLGTRHASPSN